MVNKPMKEYGLRHHYELTMGFTADDTTKRCTILPLLACDEGLTNPEDVNVNPSNSNKTPTQAHHTLYPGSVVNGIAVKFNTCIPVLGQETGIQAILFQTMMVATSFDDITTEDHSDGQTIGDFIGLKKEATNENQIHPDWSGIDMLEGDTLDSAFVGLTGGQTMEYVNFSTINYDERKRDSQIAGKLKACTPGGLRTNIIRRESPFFRRNYVRTPAKVKRSNKGTFLGMLFNVPQVNGVDQFWIGAETTATTHLRISAEVNFIEYNDMFNQQ